MRRNILKPTDKIIAILGLITRIRITFLYKIHYGIFNIFFHRNLFWKRSGVQKTLKIKYEPIKMPSI